MVTLESNKITKIGGWMQRIMRRIAESISLPNFSTAQHDNNKHHMLVKPLHTVQALLFFEYFL